MQLTHLTIRRLKKKNLNKYLNGLLECLAAFGQTKLTRSQAAPILNEKKRAGHIILVATLYDEVIGTATLILEPKFLRSGSVVGHIEDVAVLEAHRKNGVGHKLITELCDIARKNNCYKVILDCKDSNVHFYEECGFRKYEQCMRIDL